MSNRYLTDIVPILNRWISRVWLTLVSDWHWCLTLFLALKNSHAHLLELFKCWASYYSRVSADLCLQHSPGISYSLLLSAGVWYSSGPRPAVIVPLFTGNGLICIPCQHCKGIMTAMLWVLNIAYRNTVSASEELQVNNRFTFPHFMQMKTDMIRAIKMKRSYGLARTSSKKTCAITSANEQVINTLQR